MKNTDSDVRDRAAGIQGLGSDLGKRMEAVMRIRRNILAPAILTVGTIGSLVAGPVLALTTTAAPATAAVAASASPNMVVLHG